MAHCSTSHHSAQTLEIGSSQELVRAEVILQSTVNLFVGDFLKTQIPLQALHFEDTEFSLQCLVGTKLDAFQLYLG